MPKFKCALVGDFDDDEMKPTLLTSYDLPENTVYVSERKVDVTVDGQDWTLAVSDISVLDEHYHLKKLLYCNADVFLVCFSIGLPKTFESVKKKWVPEITIHRPEARFLLVGLQVHLREDTTLREKLAKEGLKPITAQEATKLAFEMGAAKYVECSSLTRESTENVFYEATLICLKKPSNREIDSRITFLKKNSEVENDVIVKLVAMKKKKRAEKQKSTEQEQRKLCSVGNKPAYNLIMVHTYMCTGMHVWFAHIFGGAIIETIMGGSNILTNYVHVPSIHKWVWFMAWTTH